jgi:ribonuclease HI
MHGYFSQKPENEPMSGKSKYYVVWDGRSTGVFNHWDDCKKQVEGFDKARYKAFQTEEEAISAYKEGWKQHLNKKGNALKNQSNRPTGDYLTVDAACSGNPGKMEYRGVYPKTGQEIFRQGPFENGTNNIGEFLAIVHALALQKSKNTCLPIYSDSANAILWVKKKRCNTKLEKESSNEIIFDLIQRAETWLKTNSYLIPVLKWETALWGEIPADFGRK